MSCQFKTAGHDGHFSFSRPWRLNVTNLCFGMEFMDAEYQSVHQFLVLFAENDICNLSVVMLQDKTEIFDGRVVVRHDDAYALIGAGDIAIGDANLPPQVLIIDGQSTEPDFLKSWAV